VTAGLCVTELRIVLWYALCRPHGTDWEGVDAKKSKVQTGADQQPSDKTSDKPAPLTRQ